MTTKAHYFINSTFANMPRHSGQQGAPRLEVNPADALRLGLEDGALVEARNAQGALEAQLSVTDTVIAGTAVLEGKYWWTAAPENTPVGNRLTEGSWSPGGQPGFNDSFVEIRAAPA